MWQPKKIKIENLMTHLDTEYNFVQNNCVMIYGENKTDPGTNSNGAGKSTIIEGITLATTGQVNRDIKKDGFINDEEDDCFVQFDLTNEIGDVNNLSINRWFHRRKSSKVEIWENGELNSQITSVNEANSRIYELLGINRDDLLKFFIIGQDTNYCFLKSGDVEKKRIISRFSNTTLIEQKVELLKTKQKAIRSEQEGFETELTKIETEIEFLNEQLTSEKEDFKKNIKSQIEFKQEEITENEKDFVEISKRLKKRKAKIKDLEKDLEKLKKSIVNLVVVKGELKNTEKILKGVKKDIRDNKDLKYSLEHALEGGINCPKCEHKFNPNSDIDIEDIPDMMTVIDTEIEADKDSVKVFEKEIEALNLKMSSNDKTKRKIESTKGEIEDLEGNIASDEKKIVSRNNYTSKLKKEIEKLKGSFENNDKISRLKERLKKSEDKFSEVEKSLIGVQKKMEDNEFWIHHFGKKGFLTFITNKSIKSIEGITNSYLQKINTDLQVSIEGFTVLKSGELREKIDVNILRNGKMVGVFDRYSGGERGRINLANIVGMQKLFNMSLPNGGLNFLALDEVFEELDMVGQQDLVNILDNLGVTTLVVSHRNEPIGAKNELLIKKEDGISYILK